MALAVLAAPGISILVWSLFRIDMQLMIADRDPFVADAQEAANRANRHDNPVTVLTIRSSTLPTFSF